MIIDEIKNISKYGVLIPEGDKIVAFFKKHPLESLREPKYDIEGTEYFFNPGDIKPIPVSEKRWEVHYKHIDIHFVISGVDRTGWIPVSFLKNSAGYNEEADAEFFTDTVEGTSLWIPAGYFVFFGPQDAHKPSINLPGIGGKKSGFKGLIRG
ncbi:hypothetical protein AGMMS50268_39060 [Spirochaetia bacterium]|nr:hypothetical protein AGMMS50268_39060 [Spirochaetia bacterium]